MKALFAAIAVACAVFGIWQRTEIESLRETERSIIASAPSIAPGENEVAKPGFPSRPSLKAPVSDEEAARFAALVVSQRADLEGDRYWRDLIDGARQMRMFDAGMRDTFSRLSSAQIRDVMELLRGEGEQTDQTINGVHRFMLLSGMLNPQPTIELMYQLKTESGVAGIPGSVSQALESWFELDPGDLLRWARERGIPDGFNGECAIWTAAAIALTEPTAENIKRFLAHKGYSADRAAPAIAWKLSSPEAHVAFFKNLHSAAEGKLDGIVGFIWPLARKLPFAQAAQIADSVPAFHPVAAHREDLMGKKIPIGSLRYQLACSTRDGTIAQRWDWLVSRPEDRPNGELLSGLLNEWCEREYSDVAAWARTLPPGTDRTEIRKGILAFVKHDQDWDPNPAKKHLAAEWEAP